MLGPDMYSKRVEDFMSEVEWSVEPLDPISEALGKMKRHRVQELPVIEKGKLKGLITFRNLARRRKMPLFAHVKSFMIVPPHIRPTDKVAETAERFITRDFSALPVTTKEVVKGMISRRDLIRAMAEEEVLKNISVETIMNFGPNTIRPDVGMKRALMLMELSNEPSLAVTDAEGRFFGSITTSDIASMFERPQYKKPHGDYHGEKTRRDRDVSSFAAMPETLVRMDPISKVIEMMLRLDTPLIYVLDGDKLVGSVSEVDVLEILLRGPVTGGPLIQVAGLEDAKMLDASELQSIISKFLQKIERLTTVTAVTVRIRHHHHREDDDKYTVNIKLTTPEMVVSREAYDWDLLLAIGTSFVNIEKHIKKEHSKKHYR